MGGLTLGGGGGTNIRFCQIFSKNCMKLKEFEPPRGVRVSHPAYTLYEEHAILTDPKTVLQWLYLIIFFKVQSEFSV